MSSTEAMLVGVFGSVGLTSITEPSGMVERTEQQSLADATYKITAAASDQMLGGTGPSRPREATSTFAQVSIGQVLALRPDGG